MAEGVDLHFARGIEDFVKAHSPSAKPATAAWAAGHVDAKHVTELKRIFRLLAEGALRTDTSALAVLSATEPILQFKTGSLYEVSDESEYAELEYEGSSALDISEGIYYLPSAGFNVPSAAITAGQVSIPYQFEGGLGFNTFDAASFRGIARPSTTLPKVDPFVGFITPTLSTTSVLLSAAFTVSLRLVNGEINQLEVYPDTFREIARENLPGRPSKG